MFSADLSAHEGGDHVVVALRGELDMADAASIAATLTEIAARGPTIIVNLAALEFMDSSGVAALARGRRQARQAGGDLVLAAAQQQVLRILVLTRLADAFLVHASVNEAIFSAGQASPALLPVSFAVDGGDSVDDVAGQLGQGAVMVAGVAAQDEEGIVGAGAEPLSENSLGLLDHDAAVQRHL